MKWHKIDLEHKLYGKVLSELQPTYLMLGTPKGFAVYQSKLSSPFPHEVSFTPQILIYFSPKTAELCSDYIHTYDAKPCDEPNPSEVNLLAGEHLLGKQ